MRASNLSEPGGTMCTRWVMVVAATGLACRDLGNTTGQGRAGRGEGGERDDKKGSFGEAGSGVALA